MLIHVYHFTKDSSQNHMVSIVSMNLCRKRWLWTNCLILLLNFKIQGALNFTNLKQIQNFGEPFFFVIHLGETLSEVKERIKKKLQIPDEEFSKVNNWLHNLQILFHFSCLKTFQENVLARKLIVKTEPLLLCNSAFNLLGFLK